MIRRRRGFVSYSAKTCRPSECARAAAGGPACAAGNCARQLDDRAFVTNLVARISGGWPGVDHMVCREYVDQLRRDQAPTSSLTHVVPANSTPDLWALERMRGEGRLDASGSPEASWHRSLEAAKAVVVIGGLGGTQEIVQAAGATPVFPVGGTGGVADELPGAYWRPGRSGSPIPESSRPPITSRGDARTLVLDVIARMPPPLGDDGPTVSGSTGGSR